MCVHSGFIPMMTWSYSRLKTFKTCKYSFLLKYIEEENEQQCFFSSYGNLIHGLLEQYYKGGMPKREVLQSFLAKYPTYVVNAAPPNLYASYFKQGREYFELLQSPPETVLGVEENLKFTIDGYKFTGFVDLLLKDGKGLIIQDNKTRILKRSTDNKIRKCDEEFSEFARQLYLYSIGIKQQYGEYPYRIQFNCFRNNTIVSDTFNQKTADKTKEWVLSTIEEINNEKEWLPSPDWFQCKYICGLSHVCEYAQIQFGNERGRII